MTDVGRPMLKSGLNKIEQGERRVDVDDLVGLALALDVSPARLLLTDTADNKSILLTNRGHLVKTRAAWAWAAGEHPLSEDKGRTKRVDLNRQRRFVRENRPHNPPDEMPVTELMTYRDDLQAVAEAVEAAVKKGVPRRSVIAYIELLGSLPGATTEGGTQDG
jgi:transcriptional regulator with XRE-family HTH domain